MPTPTHVLTEIDTVDRTSYTTASHTITANRLVLLAACGHVSAGTVDTPTVTGHGATWVLVNSRIDQRGGIFVFRTMVGANDTGTVTISFGAQTQINAAWSIVEFANVDTSGTNGSGAVVQSAVNGSEVDEALTVTLSAFSSGANRPYAGWYSRDAGTDLVPEANWTQLGEAGATNVVMTMWKDATDDATPSASHTGTTIFFSGVAVEVKAAGQAPRSMHQYRQRRG